MMWLKLFDVAELDKKKASTRKNNLTKQVISNKSLDSNLKLNWKFGKEKKNNKTNSKNILA